jgi:hypothetical protein
MLSRESSKSGLHDLWLFIQASNNASHFLVEICRERLGGLALFAADGCGASLDSGDDELASISIKPGFAPDVIYVARLQLLPQSKNSILALIFLMPWALVGLHVLECDQARRKSSQGPTCLVLKPAVRMFGIIQAQLGQSAAHVSFRGIWDAGSPARYKRRVTHAAPRLVIREIRFPLH